MTTVSSGQSGMVSSGASDSGDIVLSGGAIVERSGGKESGAIVSAGGTETLSRGGTQIISAHGLGTGQTVDPGGLLDVENGSEAEFATIASGGALVVSSGAAAFDINVASGASVIVLSGAVAVVTSAGATTLYLENGNTVAIPDGIAVQSGVISSGGVLTVRTGNFISGATVADGGEDIVLKSGGTFGDVLPAATAIELGTFLRANVAAKSHLLTDGFMGYQGRDAALAGHLKHTSIIQGDGPKAAEFFPIIHTVFSNMKAWLVGTHHSVSAKHLPRYPREWTYRFNRRNRVDGMGKFLLRRAMDCASITYEQLVAGIMPGGAARNRRVQPVVMPSALAG